MFSFHLRVHMGGHTFAHMNQHKTLCICLPCHSPHCACWAKKQLRVQSYVGCLAQQQHSPRNGLYYCKHREIVNCLFKQLLPLLPTTGFLWVLICNLDYVNTYIHNAFCSHWISVLAYEPGRLLNTGALWAQISFLTLIECFLIMEPCWSSHMV